MTAERSTSQKEIILDYLKGVQTHPTAKVVYSEVRKKIPRISLGTVYRNLKNLSDREIIQEIPVQESHYDADISRHVHFVCEKCGRIFDIFDICKDCKVLCKEEIKVGKINRFQINLYGECRKCFKGKRK